MRRITRRLRQLTSAIVGTLTLTLVAETPHAQAPIEPIRVGIYDNPPKVFVDDAGRPTGFWPELTRVIAERRGWEIEWVPGTWADGLRRLGDRQIDVMVDVGLTESRRERYRFAEESVHVSWSRIYRRPGADIETIPDLRGKRIGGLRESFNLNGPDGLRELLDEFGVQAEIVALPTYGAVFEALEQGRIDAGVTNRDFGNRIESETSAVRTSIVFQPAELHYAFPRGAEPSAALAGAFDEAVAALKDDPGSPYHQLLDRWLGRESKPTVTIIEVPRWAVQSLALLGVFVVLAVIALYWLNRRLRGRQRQLLHSRSMLAQSQRLATIGSWRLDQHTGDLEWSDETYRICGVSPEAFTPTTEAFLALVHTDDRELLPGQRDLAMTTGKVQDVEFRLVQPDGAERIVHERIEPEIDGYGRTTALAGTIQDITEQELAERERERLNEELAHILGSITDAFLTVDGDWNFQYVNAQAGQIMGKRPEDMRGRNAWELFPEGLGTIFEEKFRRSMEVRETTSLEEYYPPFGMWLEIRVYPIHDGLALYFRDVTDRYAMLQRLQERDTALEQSRDALQAALEMRQTIINALPAHIALVDGTGVILDVNEQWRAFGRNNEIADPHFGIGENYLRICEQAHSGDDGEEAARVRQGLSELLHGSRAHFSLEYPCHSPDEQRWFRLMANRLGTGNAPSGEPGAVVMHVDITERKLAEQELNRIAYQDPLTALPSRTGFNLQLEETLADSGWHPRAALALLNLRNQRDINDAYGYEVGDQLLIAVAHRLQAAAGAGALLGRIGGDEFVVFLPGDDPRTFEEFRLALASVFDHPIALEPASVAVDGQFGYTILGQRRRGAEELIREAAVAMVAHAQQAQNWGAYTEELDREIGSRVELTHELLEAIEEHQFELHLQPKVSLTDGSLRSAEALIRWRHPDRGLQLPGLFMPVAERSQLIAPIGAWVVREACRLLSEWQQEGLDIVRIAANVSVVQLTMGGFASTVADALDAYGVPPAALTLEITESVFGRESDELLVQLRELHELGVRLSLDDFGTGYSSLLYLQRYPFDEIKIDQGFVRQLRREAYSRHIVETVLNLAAALDAEVVAEGIEDAGTARDLLSMGCKLGQGFHYSMPLEAEDFRWLLLHKSQLPLEKNSSG